MSLFAEFTVSLFASLRAVRKRNASGLGMTRGRAESFGFEFGIFCRPSADP